MMRAAVFLLVLLIVTAPAAAQRTSHGIFFRWGAFAEENARRCFAIGRPEVPRRPADPFASVSFGRGSAAGGELHVRLARAPRGDSAVLLLIDDRPFQLMTRGRDGWASSADANKAIVAAMRTGGVMTIDTYAAGGRVRDRYLLRGVASAIDAAAVACATR